MPTRYVTLWRWPLTGWPWRLYYMWSTSARNLSEIEHGMQTRSSDENSVCPSVRLPHACIVTKSEEKSDQIFIPYGRSFRLVFSEEEWLVEATPSTWNFGSTGQRWSEITDFEPIFACSASALTPSEKISLTLIGCLHRAFQRA